MESIPASHFKGSRIAELVRQREIQESTNQVIFKKLHVTENLIARLGLEKELKGHTGCVNCLEWNETGEMLASTSDDLNIALWNPFRYEKILILPTGHRGNIFSVKFMPKSNDRVLISGAADYELRVHDISAKEPMLVCNCHTARVKRLATSPTLPFVFWSAAEDGLVLQSDVRVPHRCKSDDFSNIVVNLVNHAGISAVIKCIAINPKRPELIAVGANDAYIRMYDRRFIKLQKRLPIYSGNHGLRTGNGDPEDNVPLSSTQYFVAGHLRESTRNLNTTYLTFSQDGNELLVNMGGEQIYLFDINNPKRRKTFFGSSTRKYSDPIDNQENGRCRVDKFDLDNMEDLTDKNVEVLPPHVEEIKRQANAMFENENFIKAINFYNKAINFCPNAAVLFANRAAAYMKRGWDGDTYAALRDCQTALILDPEKVKAHFRLARCLHLLNRPSEAEDVLRSFQRKFPEYASKPSCKALKSDIKKAIEAGKESSLSGQALIYISAYEGEWRREAIDYKLRFCGHCNTTTDIKEANFFGNSGQFIVAGSDDGSFFVWDRKTTNILRVLHGDGSIVNCLQPHPRTCLLATSGIDPVIRLWSPLPEDGTTNNREVPNLDDAAVANQIRMNSDPFEVMLLNMGYRFPVFQPALNEDNDDLQEPSVVQALNCRPS